MTLKLNCLVALHVYPRLMVVLFNVFDNILPAVPLWVVGGMDEAKGYSRSGEGPF